ncbi:trans-sulfuration enzyme family protein [Actinomadura rudentiformis]|uniref:homocysteine desulfhydrase n=1 Tax=Actinomadura rudentiformis TaxID=359158 RepID=A0A6H9YB40_9ACTN|nr:aminotransferase class I/II-fold pyridoxal phosphate-dependent enzyme [Actinomadura rudentiformis]KAB2342471.1 aminotransferase class I/II-fold pyridoxal phosphate-dependent enzyme [Actinomadura rudentiformis]
MRRDTRRQGENTRAVHLPSPPVPQQSPVGLPVWRTSAFAFAGAAEHAELVSDHTAGYSHGRVANPTADAFAAGLASLEGAGLGGEPVEGQAFGSGMAAVTAVFLAFARAGAHVVAPSSVYRGTRDLLTGTLNRFGVGATFADMTDPEAVRAAMRPTTRLVWAETISESGLDVPRLPLLAEIAHEGDALLAVDSTLATPVVCRPLEYGADLVVHSASTFIGGHGDATGGAVIGGPQLLEAVRRARIETGSVLAPDEAFLLRRGLETLPVRVRRQCDTANLFAAAVAGHPAVRAVDYPGLPGHPGHDAARKLFTRGPEGTRFGAIVTVTPRGGRDAGLALVDALRLPMVATSIGGTHTTVAHVASTTHHRLDEAGLAAAGVDPAAVRFSIGLEDADDLVRDVTEALDTVSRVLRPSGPSVAPPGPTGPPAQSDPAGPAVPPAQSPLVAEPR